MQLVAWENSVCMCVCLDVWERESVCVCVSIWVCLCVRESVWVAIVSDIEAEAWHDACERDLNQTDLNALQKHKEIKERRWVNL